MRAKYNLFKNNLLKISRGFSLLEMLFVLVIVTSILLMAISYVQRRTLEIRIDRTAIQVQQILNAGLAYYVANNKWPTSIYCLQGTLSTDACKIAYLPQSFRSPLGSSDYALSISPANTLRVTTEISYAPVATIATVLAGRLPLSFATNNLSSTSMPVCSNSDASCYVVAEVNIPGQNLNNATAINFSGIYTHGSCVPVPQCPVDKSGTTVMVPQIMVAPASISGFGTTSTNAFTTGSPSPNIYPISSFTAYAKPPAPIPDACADNYKTDCPTDGTYWRVCAQITTEKGVAKLDLAGGTSGKSLANAVSLIAFTRCAIPNESSGTPYEIFS